MRYTEFEGKISIRLKSKLIEFFSLIGRKRDANVVAAIAPPIASCIHTAKSPALPTRNVDLMSVGSGNGESA